HNQIWLNKHRFRREGIVARPTAKELTERELEVMHVFWNHGAGTAQQTRDKLAESGLDRAYVTVANLIRLLVEKEFLEAANSERPFVYRAIRTFEDVSGSLIGDLVQRVFSGSRELLLVQILGGRKKLTQQERSLLEQILKEQD
ncbi:MAG: putative transcriptional regulator, partial [Planctomycetaceae bacterium]|nr:putative transcriptional regulator [Planctomycetaceae bacterium]